MIKEFAIEIVARRINRKIRSIGFIDAKGVKADAHVALAANVAQKIREVQKTVHDEATETRIKSDIEEQEKKLSRSLGSANWKKLFRGRDVLRRLCAVRGGGLRYETLRNVIVNEMARDGYQPKGMAKTLGKILARGE